MCMFVREDSTKFAVHSELQSLSKTVRMYRQC